MRRIPFVLAVALLGCGGGESSPAGSGGAGASSASTAGSGGGGGGGGGGGAAASIPFACPGATLVSGENKLTIGGKERTFYVDLPADTTTPAGIVLSFHGYGDTAANFRAALGVDPDAVPGTPFIIVTPEDTGLFPPKGLDWGIFVGALDQPNDDAALVEAILGCAATSFSVNAHHVHALGFSAGAIMANLMHTRYPTLVGSSLAYSGAWFNDAVEVAGVNTAGFDVEFNWPALDPADGGTVVLTHGGSDDWFGFGATKVLDFEASAQAAFPFLTAAGRTVIECSHDNGHQPHPQVTTDLALSFFAAHPLGAPSPYLAGGLTGFPASCTLLPSAPPG
jgi:predicted esterase